MAPAHALLLLGATADLFCALVKPEDKENDLPKPKTSSPKFTTAATVEAINREENLPQVRISPSVEENKRRASIRDFSFNQKLSSFDSINQHKVSRSGSQTKRKISPSDVLPYNRMSVSEPRFQRRISLSEMPQGQVMATKGTQVRYPTDSISQSIKCPRGKLTNSVRRPAYQFRSLSTEIPPASYSTKHKPNDTSPYHLKGVTSSESELKTSFSDISPVSYHVRTLCRDP